MLILLICLFLTSVGAHERIRMKDIKALTFVNNKLTTGNRKPPVLQMVCAGGDACGESHKIEVIQCVNVGSDGSQNGISWRCETQLPKSLRLGSHTKVSCEGYSHSDDPYILAGSCGVEYSLHYTNKQRTYNRNTNMYHSDNTDFWNIVYVVIVFIVLICVVWCIVDVLSNSNNHRYDNNHRYNGTRRTVHNYYDNDSGFTNGYVVGSLSRRNIYTTPSAPPSYNNDDNDTHTSTSYGTTSNR